MTKIYTPTQARQNLYQILKNVNSDRKPVLISPTKKGDKGAVVIGEEDWEAIQETLFLVNSGVAQKVKDRENDPVEDFDEMWDSL